MRILYLSQYFPPEVGATQARTYEMARQLVQHGYDVTVITEIPNHPSGTIPEEYRGKMIERTTLDGINVIRVWVKTSPVKSFVSRMLFYISYMISCVLAGAFIARGKYHLIYATSPPLFVGAAGIAIAAIKRAALLFEVRDLWPESAVELGELSNPTAIRLASRLENLCYSRAKKIIVVTQTILNTLADRGIPPEKLALIPNGANTDLFQYQPDSREHLREKIGLKEKFVAVYAGIHGIAQGLETVIEAAQLLQNNPEIHFLMIGEGPQKQKLMKLSEEYRQKNVTFIGEVSREQIPAYLSSADIVIVPLRRLRLSNGALPSKMFDAWACSRPMIISIDGEARKLVEAANGGIFIPPEEPMALKNALIRAMGMRDELTQMGVNGRAFTEKHYSRKALADRLASEIRSLE